MGASWKSETGLTHGGHGETKVRGRSLRTGSGKFNKGTYIWGCSRVVARKGDCHASLPEF